ncbi:MAG: hypothetical protein RLZZ44_47 [Bacteroidota bacterium]|jgi:organic radical activating enzyme
MTNNFCGFLSNGLLISDKNLLNELSYKPCGVYENYVDSVDKINWRTINDWTDSCQYCYNTEYVKKEKSKRYYSKTFQQNNNNLLYLDIDFSNICNAACGMCSSIHSSTIYKIDKMQNIASERPTVKQEKILNVIDSLNLTNLQVLKLWGGEPFFSNFHKKILKKIPNPNQVEVLYQTNGSIYPDKEWWEIASLFKNIDIIFSIDAIGERFNFIRTNLNYDEVEENLIRIISNKNINLTTGINCTLNPMNVYYFDEMFSLLKKMKKEKNKVNLNWQRCFGMWDLSNSTPILREKINEKYKGKLFSNLFDILKFDDNQYKKFIQSIKLHEKRFKLNCKETFPEIYDYLIIN